MKFPKEDENLKNKTKENKMSDLDFIGIYKILTDPNTKPEIVKVAMISVIKDRIKLTENYLENLKRDLEKLKKK